MREPLRRHAEKLNQMRRKNRRRSTVVVCLACLVMASTVFALIKPAITAEGTTYCGFTEHAHSESCYERNLVCPLSEGEAIHSHTADCFTTELILTCGLEESEGHVHTEDCLDGDGNLTCGLTEGEGAHTHSEDCYTEEQVLTCGLSEEPHIHTEDCYESILICDLPEHVHSLACYSNPNADVETAADWEQSFADVELTGVWPEDLLDIAQTQLGYQESESNYIVLEDGVTTSGYTRYGDWYGDPYGDWCAMFVSFCLNYAGIPEEVFPSESSCSRWVVLLEEYGFYVPADEGLPQAGGLVFFDNDGDGGADHVGIVSAANYAEAEEDSELAGASSEQDQGPALISLETIGGNFDGAVALRTHDAADETILGYAILPDGNNGIMALAEDGTEAPWGYNRTESGAVESIWWTDPKLVLTTEIQENKAYVIAGNSGNHVMAGSILYCDYTYRNYDSHDVSPTQTFMTATAKPSEMSEQDFYEQNQVWNFEKTDSDSSYYIYIDSTSGRQYLAFDGAGWRHDGSNLSRELTLTSDETSATIFTVKPSDGDTTRMEISASIDGNTYYLNTAGGDGVNNGCYGYFWGWNKSEGGSWLRIGSYEKTHTASPVETVSPSSTIINLFDYWKTARTGVDDSQDNNNTSGINAGHDFWFDTRSSGDGTKMNIGTGNTTLTQGIVANKLGADGYPMLSGTSVTDDKTESLNYLFDTSIAQDGKASYRDVQGLLQVDSQGYFYYDSRYNMVEFPIDGDGNSTNRNSFIVYDKPGVYPNISGNEGEFFPFNKAPQVAALHANNNQNIDKTLMNHYFGMTVTTRFIQRNNGYTKALEDGGLPTTFHFSGDDDVWIFIDDVLVADLGGKHTRVGVTIDFTNGSVTYDNGVAATTIRSAFETALAAGDPKLAAEKWNGSTFANNTTHTLKFYYLERGNHDSNLDLKFNLIEIPPTSVYKVDQYNNKLANAAFAVYKADEGYRYLGDPVTDPETGATTTPVYTSAEVANFTIEENSGKIYENANYMETGEDPKITPAYYGVTSDSGDMVFVDGDDSPYTIAELEGIFGKNFILREVKVPPGYRTVTDEAYLYTDGTTIFSEDPYKTGVWASPNAMVTATNTLYAVAANEDGTHNSYRYYEVDSATTRGTLFAVVLKRNGQELSSIDSWYPVYGSDEVGYTVIGELGADQTITYTDTVTNADGSTEKVTYDNQMDAVIAAAKTAQQYGSTVFKYSASGMQVTLENLPGKPERYYTYMQQQNGGELLHEASGIEGTADYVPASSGVTASDPQYFVAYYYTDEDIAADGWDAVTSGNTRRVISRDGILTTDQTVIDDEGVTAQAPDYSGFSIQWGATIEVPNLENRLFVQKLDTAENRIDGATFALYEAFDAKSKTQGIDYNYIYYVGEDANGDTVYVGILDPDGSKENSAIVFGGDPVSPLGRGSYLINHDSTSPDWGKITVSVAGADGTPTLYSVSPAVNAEGKSLIDTTHLEKDYVDEDGTAHFTKLTSNKYYLREISPPAGYELNTAEIPVLVNENGVYANAGVKEDGVAVGNGIGYLTRTLDVFASPGEIDETLTWVYGALIENDAKDFSAFDEVSGDVLHVGEDTSGWYFVTQDPGVPDGYGTGEDIHRGNAMVTYLTYDGALANLATSTALFDYSPTSQKSIGADGEEIDAGQDARETLPDGVTAKDFIPTLAGEGTRRLYTDTGWSDMAIYQDYAYGVRRITTGSTTNYDDLTGYGNISNLFSSSTFVQVTDKREADLVIKKVDSTGKTTLSGAQFRLHRLENVTVEAGSEAAGKAELVRTYYSRNENGVVQWVQDEGQAMVVITSTDGLGKVFSSLTDGVYELEETLAPEGYYLLSSAVEVKISGGRVTLTNTGTADADIGVDGGVLNESSNRYVYTITIPNSTGYELPETGGVGTTLFYVVGAALLAGGVSLLAVTRKKGRTISARERSDPAK